jgi:hypothetical protein
MPSGNFDAFAPTPLGNDEFAIFGASGSQPVFANFDPPPFAGASVTVGMAGMANPRDPLDVNNDGRVVPLDVLVIINAMNELGPGKLPDKVFTTPRFAAPNAYLDANRDGSLSPFDALVIINHLNQSSIAGEGESLGQWLAVGSHSTSGDAEYVLPVVPLQNLIRGELISQIADEGRSVRSERPQPATPVGAQPVVRSSTIPSSVLDEALHIELDDPILELLEDLQSRRDDDDALDEIFGDW